MLERASARQCLSQMFTKRDVGQAKPGRLTVAVAVAVAGRKKLAHFSLLIYPIKRRLVNLKRVSLNEMPVLLFIPQVGPLLVQYEECVKSKSIYLSQTNNAKVSRSELVLGKCTDITRYAIDRHTSFSTLYMYYLKLSF